MVSCLIGFGPNPVCRGLRPIAKGHRPDGLGFYPSVLRDGCCLHHRMAVLAAAERQMRRALDRTMTAQRYLDCADENTRRANNAISAKERQYYTSVAVEYLLLAKRVSLAGYRQNPARRSDEYQGAL
jgi:hypothetical protein